MSSAFISVCYSIPMLIELYPAHKLFLHSASQTGNISLPMLLYKSNIYLKNEVRHRDKLVDYIKFHIHYSVLVSTYGPTLHLAPGAGYNVFTNENKS